MTDPPITAADIGRHITALTAAGPRHPDSGGAAAAASLRYLTDHLAGWGYSVTVERYGPDLYDVNLIATADGAAQRSGAEGASDAANVSDAAGDRADVSGAAGVTVEVVAHWDTVAQSPGADDNASGVAGALEVARVLAGSAGVRLCFFGGEEDGLRGSIAHVAGLANEPAAAGSVGAVVLEMIGYRRTDPGSQRVPPDLAALITPPRRGDFIAIVADQRSAEYAAAFRVGAETQAPELAILPMVVSGVVAPTLARSDHLPYWSTGRKALLVTDTAEFRNPHYHRESDTPDTLDLEFAVQVTRAVVAMVRRLVTP